MVLPTNMPDLTVRNTWFDDFSFQARFMPVACAMLPLISIGIIKSVINQSIVTGTFVFFMLMIFMVFASKIARERGEIIQNNLFNELKAKPTTIIMRFTDHHINETSKQRYHIILNNNIINLHLPTQKSEENENSDEQYITAIDWLRVWANNNRNKAPLAYKELKEYNFWRNLLGIKWISIIIYLIFIIREYIIIDNFSLNICILQTKSTYYPMGILSFSILALMILVRKETVKRKAFDYAKALVESTDSIDKGKE